VEWFAQRSHQQDPKPSFRLWARPKVDIDILVRLLRNQPAPGSWVDLEDATRRLDRAEGAVRHGKPLGALPEATVASSILRRPFLRGSEGDWIDGVRLRKDVALYWCYEVLAQGWCDQGQHRLAGAIAERAIILDPLRETGYRLLMEAELAHGDSIAALHVFDRCERIVMAEFGASPSQRTIEVAERARRL